jgi:diguanylate cyclase (GGDEF)-like protein
LRAAGRVCDVFTPASVEMVESTSIPELRPLEATSLFSQDQLASVLSKLPDPAFILTRGGCYAAIFGGVDTRYYHDGSALVGQRIQDVLHADKAQWFLAQIEIALRSRSLSIVEYTLSGSDVKGLETEGPEAMIWFEGRIQALDFLVDGDEAVVWVASNITAKKEVEEKLREQTVTDPLTGLFNRRKLDETLAERHALFAREGIRTAALLFDIDNFKQINDRLGHAAGDGVLARIGAVCREHLQGDIMARLGGDEFVILMTGLARAEAESRANLLRHLVSQSLARELGLTASISGGLAEFLPGDIDGEALLQRADVGLYDAKHRGRDCISAIWQDADVPQAVASMA